MKNSLDQLLESMPKKTWEFQELLTYIDENASLSKAETLANQFCEENYESHKRIRSLTLAKTGSNHRSALPTLQSWLLLLEDAFNFLDCS